MSDVLDEASAGNGLVAAFQQLVELPSQRGIGYEALARWPTLNYPAPVDVFAHAEKTGRLDQLDRLCIRAAVQGALRGGLTPGTLLLINCEPAAKHVDPAEDADLARAAERFQIAFELTERGLLGSPRTLLRKVAALRSLGFAIALDDIGSHPDSVALLDILAPDIVKLDVGLVQQQPNRTQARTVAAITAHHERTGAVICAEGIETDDHLEQALAYGATLGQGNRFGAPGGPMDIPQTRALPLRTTYPLTSIYPATFDLAIARLQTRTTREQTVTELSRHIERNAAAAENAPIVLAALQSGGDSRAATRTYSALAESSPLVAVFGESLPAELGPRVRRVEVGRNDPLSLESTIVVLGPDSAAALIARERRCRAGSSEGILDRRYDMAMTFDREHVTTAARTLLDRLG